MRRFVLVHQQARDRAAQAVTEAPEGFEVVIKPQTRTSAENALLHTLIAQIAAQLEWAGARRDAEIWKRLLVAAWCRVRGEPLEILPAVDGHGVDIVPARTSKLSKSDAADLISYIESWGTEAGVKWSVDR